MRSQGYEGVVSSGFAHYFHGAIAVLTRSAAFLRLRGIDLMPQFLN
jgi:hypothetical protein